MSHGTLCRIRTAPLLDAALLPIKLARHVETVGPKLLSDGIELAPDGNILITDIEHSGVARLDTHGLLETLVTALARLRAGKPYHIYRFRLPGAEPG